VTYLDRHLPDCPPHVHSLGQLLARFLWIDRIQTGWSPADEVQVRGLLKPAGEPNDAAAVRRAFLDTLDIVLELLAEVGIGHSKHPELEISGAVQHRSDGSWSFDGLQCRVELFLLHRRQP
jgi:hypothetical protein